MELDSASAEHQEDMRLDSASGVHGRISEWIQPLVCMEGFRAPVRATVHRVPFGAKLRIERIIAVGD